MTQTPLPHHLPKAGQTGALTDDDRDVLNGSRLFRACPQAVHTIAHSLATPVELAHGQYLIEPGQANQHVFVIIEGQVGVFTDPGLQNAVARFARGEFLGEHSLINPQGGAVFVAAQWPSRVLAIEASALRKLMTHAPQIALNVLEALSERLRAETQHHVGEGLGGVEHSAQFLATHDPVTGLHNQRWLNDAFDREINRRARDGRLAALAVLDLDHFNRLNEHIGRAAADLVLRQVADVLRRALRPTDLLARLSADRFAMLLPDCSAVEAATATERLRLQIAGRQFALRGRMAVQVTASAGVANAVGDLQSSMQNALSALERAKTNGRNQIAIFESQ